MIVTVARVSARGCKNLLSARSVLNSQPAGVNFAIIRNMSKESFPSANKQGDCPAVIQGNVGSSTQGLIVLQEWWGLNDQITEEAKMIGDKGDFVTLVPDLYRGKLADDFEEAGHLMNSLDWEGAILDIQGAVEYLLKNKGCKKVGVTGFCMGGALTLASAARVKGISAAAPFYGIPGAGLADLETITIPVQAHFGELDDIEGFSTPQAAQAMAEKVQKNSSDFKLYMYPCGHAFTNPTGPLQKYNKEQCDLAIGRLVEFMNKYLA